MNKGCSRVFTEGIDSMYFPVAHGEGKVVADPEVLPQLKVAIYYTDGYGNTSAGYPYNPNNSVWKHYELLSH
ncbi:phosphoribosylformylglycinamidine synthase subunit PurQ [Chloroflexota bacterium]